MKTTPYDTGKVKIGSAIDMNKLVNRPYVESDWDMIELQTYLIHPQHQINRAYWLSRFYFTVLFIVALSALLFL